jgi:hypothetical protein
MAINPMSHEQAGYYKDEFNFHFGIGYNNDHDFFNGFIWELRLSENTQIGPNFSESCAYCSVCP